MQFFFRRVLFQGSNASASVVQVGVAQEDLSILLAGLLLLVVAADTGRFTNWEHACEFHLSELTLVALYVLVADQTGPTFLHGQRITSFILS